MKNVSDIFIANFTVNVDHDHAQPQYTFWHAERHVLIIASMVDGLVTVVHSISNSDLQTVKPYIVMHEGT